MNIVRIQGEAEKRKGIYYELDIDGPFLGEGGMGRVYKGFCVNMHTGQRSVVAIKAVHESIQSPQLLERARREAAIQIDNENLMKMFGFIENPEQLLSGAWVKRYYMPMEFLVGVNLDDLLKGITTDQNGLRIPFAEELYAYFQSDKVSAIAQIIKALLAGIMAMQPQVLILDEPTSQLDPLAAADFLNTVRKINLELGTTVIITEHRLEDILPYADQAIVIDEGKIIACDTPRNVSRQLWQLQHPMFAAMPTPTQVYYRSGHTETPPLTVREGRKWLKDTCPQPKITQLPQEIPISTPPALELKNLWFRYEKDTPDILKGVTGAIPAGSLFAIVGGNGAGKSTLLKSICGNCKAYRGRVSVFGKALEKYSHKELFRGVMAMLPQDPKSLFVKDTVKEDLLETARDEESLMEMAQLCEIEQLLASHPYDLSGGEQQRVALAKVLLTNPQLLLLDEPTKGMDNFFKATLGEILCKLTSKGITIVMVSHDVEFSAQYADFVSIFFDGQLLATNSPKQFFGGNSFYTTAANRMSRAQFQKAVNAADIVELLRKNREETV